MEVFFGARILDSLSVKIHGMQRVALITGAGRGLGRELARRLALHGYSVSIHAFQSIAGARQLKDELGKEGASALVTTGDLTQTNEARTLVEATTRHFGRIDLLLCNSGVYHGKKWDDASETEWKDEVDSTLWPTIWMCRHAIPWLRASDHGRIVCIGDSGCDRIDARQRAVGYHMAKMGLYLFVRSLAQAEAAHGVTANMISPSVLESSFHGPSDQEMPTGRCVSPDDVYRAVKFLACPDSSQITGTNIIVGGGWNL